MFDIDTFTKRVSRNIRESKSQLITEVLNSQKNRDYFYQKFCQFTIDMNMLWKNNPNYSSLSEEERAREEGEFILLQLERKKIYVGVDFLGPIHEMMLKAGLTSRFKRIRSDFYADRFQDFSNRVVELANNKYADPAIKFKAINMTNHHAGCVWFVQRYQSGGRYVTVKLTKSVSDLLFELIIDIFNKRRAVLPKRDIFQYANNLYDLIVQLIIDTNRKSQREIKEGDASLKDVEVSTIYKSDILKVIEPKKLITGPGDTAGLRRAAEMCHKYFGIYRTSLVTGNTVPGAKWCTAVSPDPGAEPGPGALGSMHFLNKYLFKDKNNLYYFVDLRDDKIYAVRTAGANPAAIERVQTYYMSDPDLVKDPEKMFIRIMMNMTEEVITSMQSSLGSVPNLLQKFGLGLNWAQENLKFVEMPETGDTQQDLDAESNLV
jgi:hypothetical protein